MSTPTPSKGAKQTIALGPVASQEAIKQLGTNGGGFFNANSAHPFENPGPISNLIEMVIMNMLAYACVVAFGRVVGLRKEARALVVVMAIMVSGAAAAIYAAETQPTPALVANHVVATPNMEGKEVRFGAPSTAVFAAMTTGASDGAVNGMHESFTPLGGGMAMFMIQLGEMLPGGVGSGLYGMIVMALIAVFVAGLMVGRTPEYLGKKIEAREMKFAMLAVLILTASILGFAAVAAVLPLALKTVSRLRPARPVRDPLRLLLGDREQRLGLRAASAANAPSGTPPWASPCGSAASATPCRSWPSPAAWRPSPSWRPPPAPCPPTARCSSAC